MLSLTSGTVVAIPTAIQNTTLGSITDIFAEENVSFSSDTGLIEAGSMATTIKKDTDKLVVKYNKTNDSIKNIYIKDVSIKLFQEANATDMSKATPKIDTKLNKIFHFENSGSEVEKLTLLKMGSSEFTISDSGGSVMSFELIIEMIKPDTPLNQKELQFVGHARTTLNTSKGDSTQGRFEVSYTVVVENEI